MKNFRFLLKHLATIVACFAVVVAFSSCDEVTPTTPLGDKAIFEDFTFDGIVGEAIINEKALTITAKASATTNLASIAPEFVVSKGATVTVDDFVQRSGRTRNDFTTTVIYTVVSEDEETTKLWTVSITKDGKTPVVGVDANFEFFSFTGMDGEATINTIATTITIKALATTNLASITPTFVVSNGAKVTVNNVTQVSGTTANNFTNPVTYKVVSEDGKTTNNWTVTITKDNGGDGGDGDGGDGDGGDSGYGGDGSEPGYTRGAVKYKMINDGEITGDMANTFDYSKGFIRMDNWNDENHTITIVDLNNKIAYMYFSGIWTDYPYTDGSGSDEEYDETNAIIQKLANRTIAGKVCETWRITLKDGSAEIIQSWWQGLLMYLEPVKPKGMIMEATSATLEFPDSAFSQSTIEVTWL